MNECCLLFSYLMLHVVLPKMIGLISIVMSAPHNKQSLNF